MTKTMLAILRVLDKQPDKIVGAREISRQMRTHGVELTERTVRYHLKILDERGFTKVFGKEGRMITQKGREELSQALVSEKVGFIISKIETMSYLTNLDLETLEGNIILNISYFPEGKMKEANPEYVSEKAKKRGMPQLGSLGAGNHFLEVQEVDEIYDKEIARKFGRV